MSISPQTVDLLIITIYEGLSVLAKLAKREEITEEDLRLETWDETVSRIRRDMGKE